MKMKHNVNEKKIRGRIQIKDQHSKGNKNEEENTSQKKLRICDGLYYQVANH